MKAYDGEAGSEHQVLSDLQLREPYYRAHHLSVRQVQIQTSCQGIRSICFQNTEGGDSAMIKVSYLLSSNVHIKDLAFRGVIFEAPSQRLVPLKKILFFSPGDNKNSVGTDI